MPYRPQRSRDGARQDSRRGQGQGARQGRPKHTRDPVRRTAFDVVHAVDERDAYANLLLPSLLHERGLAGRDAALATELTYGTLRRRGTYDAILGMCSDRPVAKIDPPLLNVLRLGAHQLLGTRIPPHAAVGTAVDLARSVAGPGQAKFANAVLRKVAARDLDAWLAIVAPEDETGRLAVVHSHPRWIVNALRDAVGGGEIEALLAADNARPRVTLVSRPGRSTVEELGGERAAYSPYGAYLAEGDPAAVPAVAEGRAGVQDEASQLVAVALTRAPLDGPDLTWLDLCAGPGGKASLLSALAAERGAHLLACDLQPHRARLVRAGVGASASVAVVDSTRPAWRSGSFDRVLADVPCSGLGALRRRPEARWRRGPRAIAELGPLQRRLLGSAIEAARPGGVAAYVTCSPHLAETRVVVEDVLRERGDAELLDARSCIDGVPGLGDGPYAQFWPHRHGTDAMFLALIRRRG
jgi:16S rRNA (cytosine967-C5)-methyltransferase